ARSLPTRDRHARILAWASLRFVAAIAKPRSRPGRAPSNSTPRISTRSTTWARPSRATMRPQPVLTSNDSFAPLPLPTRRTSANPRRCSRDGRSRASWTQLSETSGINRALTGRRDARAPHAHDEQRRRQQRGDRLLDDARGADEKRNGIQKRGDREGHR